MNELRSKIVLLALIACTLAAGCRFTHPDRQSHREASHGLLKDADWENTKALFGNLAKCAVTVKQAGFLETAQGTGVIISQDGYVLTCAHVVELMCDLPAPGDSVSASGQDLLVVLSNGQAVNASLVAINRKFDLALLRISSGRIPHSAKPEPGLRVMPGDVLIALVREGANERVERLMTAGKVIVPYSALPMPKMEGTFASGLILRAYGYAGMSGAPLFTRNGRFVGIVKKGAPGVFGDETAVLVATPADDILRILPDMKNGISDTSYFTDAEFLRERERQNALQRRLAEETNPGFENDQDYITTEGVLKEQLGVALDALRNAGNNDRFAETILPVCVMDIYLARYMYSPEHRSEIEAFFDSPE